MPEPKFISYLWKLVDLTSFLLLFQEMAETVKVCLIKETKPHPTGTVDKSDLFVKSFLWIQNRFPMYHCRINLVVIFSMKIVELHYMRVSILSNFFSIFSDANWLAIDS